MVRLCRFFRRQIGEPVSVQRRSQSFGLGKECIGTLGQLVKVLDTIIHRGEASCLEEGERGAAAGRRRRE